VTNQSQQHQQSSQNSQLEVNTNHHGTSNSNSPAATASRSVSGTVERVLERVMSEKICDLTTSSTTSTKNLKKSASKENLNTAEAAAAAAAKIQSGGININPNNVNTILKKLGVNINSGTSALSSLISGIGSGTNVASKSVNNSVVNVNLNLLKDVNIDDMIDDDDDEERKFLIKELEKKAIKKQPGAGGNINASPGGGTNTAAASGYTSDTGSVNSQIQSTSGRVKRSRSNSSSTTTTPGVRAGATEQALTPSLASSETTLQAAAASLSQLNITLNCHYCWAQFQLNVTKNLKLNSIQQKENGKYMQHLALHLNAPYKCNECSYPITDTKTFFKHKQFYKHDEKTCIMVDNDITLPATLLAAAQAVAQAQNAASGGGLGGPSRRKTLIGTRLRALLQSQPSGGVKNEPNDSLALNEIQFSHERDSFKCSLCYPDTEPAPSTSVSTLNRSPTTSALGASNFSFDKEQVLKHVLIVHLSFLAYKCDTCAQFYAFDEPQTKQHAALVHQCGLAGDTQAHTCHFKLIKTEEEINLAINRAQQYIAKITAASQPPAGGAAAAKAAKPNVPPAGSQLGPNTPIEALPKYKCCKCNSITGEVTAGGGVGGGELLASTAASAAAQPILLYTYQDALDHVMNVHMSPSSLTVRGAKTEANSSSSMAKKLNYELELFEQNLEDLIANETGVVTTVSAKSVMAAAAANHLDGEGSDDEECGGDLCDDFDHAIDLSEWNVILSEPLSLTTNLPPQNTPSTTTGSGLCKHNFYPQLNNRLQGRLF
jgi:hypothetical protein